jgi:RHS repeat-associated protein
VFHVVGSDEAVADVIYTEAAKPTLPGTIDVRYPLTDALDTTYAVADAHGTIAERDYYDLWGQRSNPDGTPIDKPTFFQSLVSAGFTNQEHDDALGLVNMQGRMYDAVLGRFLSPDPIVGNPAFSQSWNAYSYVLNSPLNFVDLSGFDCSTSTTVSDGGKTVSTVTGCHDDLAGGGNAGATGASAVSGAFAMMQDLKRLAEQEHAVDVARGHALPDGTRVRAADGTPILPRRINSQNGNRIEDNWGFQVRGKTIGPLGSRDKSSGVSQDGALARKAADFSVRLFCGSKCASASAPKSPQEAAHAPTQLSDVRVARNALSQALAARAVVKFLGKVGVIIDEGVDGIVERMLPPGMEMANDPDAPKKPPALLMSVDPEDEDIYKLTPEEELEEATKRYNDAQKFYVQYALEIDGLKKIGRDANRFGTPVWLLDQYRREWGQEMDEAAAEVLEAQERVKKP